MVTELPLDLYKHRLIGYKSLSIPKSLCYHKKYTLNYDWLVIGCKLRIQHQLLSKDPLGYKGTD